MVSPNNPLKDASILADEQKRLAAAKEAIGDGRLAMGDRQLAQINLLPLHQEGYKGQGIRIGVADGGFYKADSLASLPREQWLGYADLTDCQHDIFSQEGNHGTLCLSAIVGQKNNYQGTATQAEYFLFRTEEHYTESPKEIDNWVAAIEMADSLGLHIVSTSLGYTTFDNQSFNFKYSDMDGSTSRGAQAAKIAARKGMLLVTAMGNDGSKHWHYLSTPADADSILSVGVFVLIGFILQLLLELLSNGAEHGHIHDEKHHNDSFVKALMILLGVSIHAFLEGFALVVNGEVNYSLLIGVVLHNIPIAMLLVNAFMLANCSKIKSFLLLSVFAIMGVVGSISKKINTIQHVNSCLHAVSSFYENVRAKYPNQYNHALYQGAINIYVRIIRRGFDKNFNASLIRIVKKHTPFWGTIL